MVEYRITKYNPANRIDGIYITEEWTSFSDIGKIFDGTKLTQTEYHIRTKRHIFRLNTQKSCKQIYLYLKQVAIPLLKENRNEYPQICPELAGMETWA